jgi:hypothetical protein
MTAMLAQGVFVEDILEALRLAIRQMSMQAQAEPMPARRLELLMFYSDADQILADACRRLDIAGRSAKKIAGVR